MSGTHGGLPWYRCYPADHLDGVKALNPEQRGNYTTVLNLIYQFGGKIADSARWIAGQCNCSVTAWNRCRAFLIEVGKLVARDGWLTNPRADRELAREAAFQEAKRASGRAGGQRSGETRRNRQADVNRENAPQEFNEINTLFPSDPSPPEDVAPVENITVPEPVVALESAKIYELFSHIPASTNELDQTVSRSRDSIASDKTLVQADSSTGRGRSLTEGGDARAQAPAPARATRKTYLPPDWQPGEKGIALARQLGFSHGEIAAMSDSMRDWAQSNAARKADWAATWRNWVREDARRRDQRAARPVRVNPHDAEYRRRLEDIERIGRRSDDDSPIIDGRVMA